MATFSICRRPIGLILVGLGESIADAGARLAGVRRLRSDVAPRAARGA